MEDKSDRYRIDILAVHEIEKSEQPSSPFEPEIPIRCQIVVTPQFAQFLNGQILHTSHR